MQRVMMTLAAAAAVCLLAPSAASAKEYTGTLEFNFGFGGSNTFDPDEGATLESDADGLIGIMPGIDKMLGKTVGLGAEFGFLWLGNSDGAGDDLDRTFILNPNLRIRMAFPIVDKVTFDGMIAFGPAIWMANDSVPKLANGDDAPGAGTRFGWAYRFNFGGSYLFNPDVAGFLSIGYYSTSSIGDDLTLTHSSIPVNIGLRSAF